MSTKIYNGYKLEGIRTLKELDAFLARLKKKIKEAQETLIIQKLALLASEFYDRHSLGWVNKKKIKKYKGYTPLSYAFMTLMEKEAAIKKNNSRNPDFDFGFEIALMFSRGTILCTLYNEKDEFRNIWESMKGVKKYPYWDNTDRPKGLSASAWRKRRNDWDKALGHSSPADAGLVKTISPPMVCFEDKSKILKAIPTLDRRLNYYANELLIYSYQNGQTMKDGEINWSLVRESMDFVRTDKGKKALLNAKKNLKPRIPKRFTIKMLTQTVRSTLVRAD